MSLWKMTLAGMAASAALTAASASLAGDAGTIAQIDDAYQAAVKRNDVRVMADILHPDFVQVYGDGRVETRAELLAKTGTIQYEIQDEEPGTRMVRLYGDTAVLTARIRVKGTRADGTSFDRRVWFSDTYVRTPAGWRYVFAQIGTAVG